MAAVLSVAVLLSACGVPGDRAQGDDLRPLSRQPSVPAGSPRSRVPSINYELGTPGAGTDLPDDGVPGDGGREVFQRGGASWYGIQFHQKKTANGERFDMGAMTAAHKTLPFNTRVCVRSLVNGKEVLVRINDRGPYANNRIIDLSRAAAEELDMIGLGIKQVALSIIDQDGMRCAGETVGPLPPSTVDPGGDAAPQKPVKARRATRRR
ncbi:MAG: septal ring lytic transglycosylase RlpA family protein [Proteobacteria bacterium]|nr:septal ring lytic transglycosylase RlpA family protein [Pseudomonadota bacterium]